MIKRVNIAKNSLMIINSNIIKFRNTFVLYIIYNFLLYNVWLCDVVNHNKVKYYKKKIMKKVHVQVDSKRKIPFNLIAISYWYNYILKLYIISFIQKEQFIHNKAQYQQTFFLSLFSSLFLVCVCLSVLTI